MIASYFKRDLDTKGMKKAITFDSDFVKSRFKEKTIKRVSF